jgi:hypothetical protein
VEGGGVAEDDKRATPTSLDDAAARPRTEAGNNLRNAIML